VTSRLDVQRVAAYGLAVVGAEVLLTRLSSITSAPGSWTLPGGGIDPGEHPRDAVLRELYEETGLAGEVTHLLGVDSQTSSRAVADDVVERYQAIRIVYRLHVDRDQPLRLIDVGGSTDEARWISLAQADDEPLVPLVGWALTLHDTEGAPP